MARTRDKAAIDGISNCTAERLFPFIRVFRANPRLNSFFGEANAYPKFSILRLPGEADRPILIGIEG